MNLVYIGRYRLRKKQKDLGWYLGDYYWGNDNYLFSLLRLKSSYFNLSNSIDAYKELYKYCYENHLR